MGRMDEEQAVFEQLTVSKFKKWSSTALKVHSQVWKVMKMTLKSFLETKSPLKMMKNAFNFTFSSSRFHDI